MAGIHVSCSSATHTAALPRELDSRAMSLAALVSVHLLGARPRPGSDAAFVVLVAFLVSFFAIRTSARLTRSVSWWPGGVQTGGVHVHHLVWGICLMMLSGFLSFAGALGDPWWYLTAVGFGVGAGLTMDEFALWVRLEDVYWTPQGRASLEAVVIATSFAALVVIGTRPFGLDDPASIWGTVGVVAVVLGFAFVAAAKGRILLAVIGVFIPVVALVAAWRLAHPRSPWARRRYDALKRERAERRFDASRRHARLWSRVGDLVAGAPTRKP